MMMKKMKSKMIRKLKGKSNLSPEELEKMFDEVAKSGFRVKKKKVNG